MNLFIRQFILPLLVAIFDFLLLNEFSVNTYLELGGMAGVFISVTLGSFSCSPVQVKPAPFRVGQRGRILAF
jgi:hypothetical protein